MKQKCELLYHNNSNDYYIIVIKIVCAISTEETRITIHLKFPNNRIFVIVYSENRVDF